MQATVDVQWNPRTL